MSKWMDSIPAWFQFLAGVMIVTLGVAVPATMYAANISNKIEIIEAGLIQIQRTIDDLERYDDKTQETVQRFEIKQARLEEKVDQLLELVRSLQ